MPDALEFILQGTDSLSPVVDQGAAAVTRLDAAGQRAFTRLVGQTVEWQTKIQALDRDIERLTAAQKDAYRNNESAEKQSAIAERLAAAIDKQVLAANRLTTAEKQFVVAAEDARQRVASAAERAAAREAAAFQQAAAQEEAAFQKAVFAHDKLIKDVQAAAAKEATAGGDSNFLAGMAQGVGQAVVTNGLSLIKEGFQAVGMAAKEALGFIITSTSDQQSALVTYARQLGDVAKAYQEMAAVKGGAVLSSRELPEVISLDQTLLARFKTMENVEALSGRTFKAVRTDILDTAAALKLSDEQMQRIGIDLQEIQSGQNVGRATQSLNMITGITRDELAKQGVLFDASGSHIISSYDAAFRAVLTTMEKRFGGMDELQSRTFAGMTANISDLGRMFSSELGEKSIGVATGYISRWIESIVNNPNLIPTLQLWGDRLGRITEAGMQMFERLGAGAQRLYVLVAPLVDLFGQWADRLPPATDGMTDLMAAAASGGTAAQAGIEGATTATEALTAAQAVLETQQKRIGRAVEDTRTAYDRLIQVQRDRATGVKRDEEDIRYATDQANTPLKDKITLLDRIYEATHKENDLAKLNRDIARDQALSKDQFSSEGRAAGLRLVGEEQQRADLIAGMAHDKEKARLQDGITANERSRDATLHGKQMEQRGIEDTIAKLEAQHRAADLAYRAEQRRIEDRLADLKAYGAAQDLILEATNRVTGAVRGLMGPATSTAGVVATIGTKAETTGGQLSIMETRLHTLGTAAAEVARAIGLAFGTIAAEVAREVGHAANQIDQLITEGEIAALQMRDFFTGQDQGQDQELQTRQAHLAALAQQAGDLDRAYDQRVTQLMMQYANPNAPPPTGAVGATATVGSSTRPGADFGGGLVTNTPRPGADFGPTVAPPTPPAPQAHTTHVEIVMQEDADGKWHKVRQVVKDELGNTANADTMARTLAPALARSR